MTNARGAEIAGYAAAVRAALVDVPERDREELLEDLEDHLAEIAAESDAPLAERLGPPETYAAELRSAFGAEERGQARRKPRALWRAFRSNLTDADRRLAGFAPYRQAREFLPELRPGWWVLRGYLAALLVFSLRSGWGLMPSGLVELAVALAAIWVSVWLGMRTRDNRLAKGWRRLIVVGNAFAVVVFLALGTSLGSAGFYDSGDPGDSEAVGVPPYSAFASAEGGSVSNIFPYSKDGKPLRDVLLYDQDGRPILVSYDQRGMRLNQPCGSPPPIANSYPLPLVEETGEPDSRPTCPPPTATPAPQPTSSGTPTPTPTPTN